MSIASLAHGHGLSRAGCVASMHARSHQASPSAAEPFGYVQDGFASREQCAACCMGYGLTCRTKRSSL